MSTFAQASAPYWTTRRLPCPSPDKGIVKLAKDNTRISRAIERPGRFGMGQLEGQDAAVSKKLFVLDFEVIQSDGIIVLSSQASIT